MNKGLGHFVDAFMRRLPLFFVVAGGITAMMLFLAIYLPTQYQARSMLLVESAQIPGDLAASTVQLDPNEQLEIMQQRLMTRKNLIGIAREFEVYEDITDMTPDAIVEQMRKDARFKATSGRDRATLLEIRFLARSAPISAEVVNEFVTRILSESARTRMRMAEGTQDFFEQEVERLQGEIDRQSKLIQEFQTSNVDALPDSLGYRLQRQSSLEERLASISRNISLLEEQRERVLAVYERTGTVGGDSLQLSPEQRELRQLEESLRAALSVYSEENPRVKILQSQVAALRAQLGAASDEDGEAEGDAILELQLTEIDSQVAYLKEQYVLGEAELKKLQDTISRTPNNTVELNALERDYKILQDQHNRALDRLSAAVTGERIELLSKGERITVIEQATAPTEPHSPNRPLIAGGGLALGIAAGIGLIILLEVLDKSVRYPRDLTSALGITPLATVPYITTRGERVSGGLRRLIILLLVVAGVPAILYYVHYAYLPLDLLGERLLDKLDV
ncbi:polysaccharide chain length determinant protein (PEP-CTERM system associated) [Aliiruegeria haliotis]|uniref:Polysaccharide chain length determinant protein (PEP-CTERM system associated) n=1 Tax=Aliiruegeria haliotis TaxID=1280846 RepID=A0A2T0RFD2_9RHOB|nr:lipopolysaccharide biosynthesis [Aliiruegeria haliotis]PRY19849.1 polysaccharide chain length determinant protein (PEP-CTERM system associated) [Aliiruegeria haliotis]